MATQGSKARDLILVVLLALLVALAFIPEKRRSSEEGGPSRGAEPRTGAAGDLGQEDLMSRGKKAVQDANQHTDETMKRADLPEIGEGGGNQRKIVAKLAPVQNVPHLFLPLVPGSQWTYNVSGSRMLVGQKSKWTIEVMDAPTESQPGVLKAGFDGNLYPVHVQLKKGAITIDSLPFIEPPDYLTNQPTKVLGEFLPVPEKVIEGSVWRNEYKRNVMYDYYDDKGRIKRVQAEALETERAQATELEQIPSPAGVFDTRRVEWVSRISLKVAGRQILAPLTTEPYRYESMWIAPGYGIVRRKISYAGSEKREVIFDLVDYRRPEK